MDTDIQKFEMFKIPVYAAKTPRWNMSVDLSGKRYQLYVSWNTRMEAWELSLSDVNGNLLIAGIRLSVGRPLLDKYKASVPELPPGHLELMDGENDLKTAEPTRDNLGTRFGLIYWTLEDE